jgi:hypothetical protein
MFSVMHIALRENNPDYQQVEQEVLHLTDTSDRAVRVISEKGDAPFHLRRTGSDGP